MKFKNVIIMNLNGEFQGRKFNVEEFKLPKHCPLTLNFDKQRCVGHAEKFRVEKDNLVADLVIPYITDTVAPSLISKEKDGVIYLKGIDNIGLATAHGDTKLNGNFLKVEREYP